MNVISMIPMPMTSAFCCRFRRISRRLLFLRAGFLVRGLLRFDAGLRPDRVPPRVGRLAVVRRRPVERAFAERDFGFLPAEALFFLVILQLVLAAL
jgi:hypothetical protein